MDLSTQVVWALSLYKIVCLSVGTIFCVLGFRLFIAGINQGAGDLEADYEKARIALKSAAPGTFFAVLGASIVVATIVQGLNFQLTTDQAVEKIQPESLKAFIDKPFPPLP